MKTIYQNIFRTEWGQIGTAATEKELVLITLPGEGARHLKKQITRLYPDHKIETGGAINRKAESQLRQYLEGKRKDFDLPLEIGGTPFQKKVL